MKRISNSMRIIIVLCVALCCSMGTSQYIYACTTSTSGTSTCGTMPATGNIGIQHDVINEVGGELTDPQAIKNYVNSKSYEARSQGTYGDADGSWRNETTVTKYTYTSNGKLLGASGSSSFTGGDGQGNTYTGSSSTSYAVIHGKAKATQTNSHTDSTDADGSFRHEDSKTSYCYASSGKLTGASGSSSFTGGDGEGNNYSGTSKTSYSIIHGKAKATLTKSHVSSQDADGSWRIEDSKTSYTYDSNGMLRDANGSATFTGGDGNGNNYTGNSSTSYAIIHGKAKATTTKTYTASKDVDGSWREENSTTNYGYSTKGVLTGAAGSSTFTGGDGQGNTYKGNSTTAYTINHGKAKATQTTTNTGN